MSQRNTLSLWQKLKQLLTGSVAQADEIDMIQTEPHDMYSSDTYSSDTDDEDTSDAHDNTEIDSESDVKNNSEH